MRFRDLAPLPALIIGALVSTPAGAAEESLRFARISVDDGLAQNSVESILQDRLGFLWFGTQEGLNRYDGYEFVVHRAGHEEGLLSNSDILALIEDGDGDLWVGTGGGLHWLDLQTGRFHAIHIPELEQPEIVVVVEDGDGRIWFGTAAGGLCVVEEPKTGRDEARLLTTEELSASAIIPALAPGADGEVWAASDGQLLRVDLEGQDAQVTVALEGVGPVSVLAAEASGHIWVGRPSGALFLFDPVSGRTRSFPEAPERILALLPQADGKLWIGARAGGLSLLDPLSGEIVTHRHDPTDTTSLSEDDVAGLYEDRLGNLWIGTWNGGVSRLDPYAQAFRTIRHDPRVADSLPDDDVVALKEAPDGRLWTGSRNGILAVGDPVAGSFETVPLGLPVTTRIRSLAQKQQDILVGTTRGLFRLDAVTGRTKPLGAALRAARLQDRRVEALLATAETLWIATDQTLIVEGPELVDRHDLPLVGAISALFASSDDRLWVGSAFGELLVGERDPVTGRHEFQQGGGPGIEGALRDRGFITSLTEDATGRVWIGTRKGLARLDLDSDSVTWLDRQDGMPSQQVVGVVVDPDGLLWLGTNRGITRLDPSTGTLSHFGSVEGAQGTGYADRAYTAGGSGVFYFGGRGITAFDPADVLINPHPPEVVFTGLDILHEQVEPQWRDPGSSLERDISSARALTLGPDASVFSVEFAGLHYSDPGGNRYRYRLEGFDTEWIETDAAHRVATYTRLAPGEYVLRVRAGTKTGVWNPSEASLVIEALPPWWRTRGAIATWFVLGGVALLGLGREVRRRTELRVALAEREALRRASLTDPLTGLSNRRFLDGYLQHEVPRVIRAHEGDRTLGDSPTDLLFVLIDLDHFKPINDRHSHAVGDQLLKAVASALAGAIRGSDLAVRWGGDEFLVVSRFVDHRLAASTAERLRLAVEQVAVSTAAGESIRCTASIGYALFPFLATEPGALSWQRTLELADRALILTKKQSRNAHTGLVAGPDLTLEAVATFLDTGTDAYIPKGLQVVTREESTVGEQVSTPG